MANMSPWPTENDFTMLTSTATPRAPERRGPVALAESTPVECSYSPSPPPCQRVTRLREPVCPPCDDVGRELDAPLWRGNIRHSVGRRTPLTLRPQHRVGQPVSVIHQRFTLNVRESIELRPNAA